MWAGQSGAGQPGVGRRQSRAADSHGHPGRGLDSGSCLGRPPTVSMVSIEQMEKLSPGGGGALLLGAPAARARAPGDWMMDCADPGVIGGFEAPRRRPAAFLVVNLKPGIQLSILIISAPLPRPGQ